MAQPATMEPNGAHAPQDVPAPHHIAPGKRKRDSTDDGDATDTDSDKKSAIIHPPARDQRELIKQCFQALASFDVDPPILKRLLPDAGVVDEPEAKRHKSAEPPSSSSIADKVAADAYERPIDMVADVLTAVKASLADAESSRSEDDAADARRDVKSRIRDFRAKAIDLIRREAAYPKAPAAIKQDEEDEDTFAQTRTVLSLAGHAPQERRLFSSLPATQDIDWTKINLPAGVSITHVVPSDSREKALTLGEVFSSPRPLHPLEAPKQPKTQAKGNTLDFYHPDPTDKSPYRSNSYFSAKLSAGHYLDYKHATPSSSAKARKHERQKSLAGKKPSTSELELSEMEALFRGAFSSFAPCKDDSAAVVPSNVAGRMWWQTVGSQSFQNMIEVEYYGRDGKEDAAEGDAADGELDDRAVQEAIENWGDTAIDPTLEEAMGTKRDAEEKEADEILDEVSDMIETLASYQRIRNLNLPNSQNRPTSDPVTGDMLATSGPQPTEEEQATYEMLKAQLALIVKTLPPYAVAKLNGDQLEDLLISTRMEVSSDQYRGVMEEDDAAMQARLRAQQAAAAAAQASARAHQNPTMAYGNQYHTPGPQYGTPNRRQSQSQQQYYRAGMTPNFQQQNYQQPRQYTPGAQQARPPQPNQYTRPNGYANQYATQLAKTQTPFGHQNMSQYASQQRPQYGQMAAQGTPNARYPYQQQAGAFPPQQQQQPGTPTQGHYSPYTNGSGMQQQQQQQQRMSPQVPPRQAYSPSPNMQHNQRYGTPTQAGIGNRYSSAPGHTTQQHSGSLGYHTVIPEAHQQRILEQAKARVAAQERSTMFGDKISQPGLAGMGVDVSRIAAARASMGTQSKPQTPTGHRGSANGTPGPAHIPHKVTPVPVPVMPGQQAQQQTQQQRPR